MKPHTDADGRRLIGTYIFIRTTHMEILSRPARIFAPPKHRAHKEKILFYLRVLCGRDKK
jgi:hypothetical protein